MVLLILSVLFNNHSSGQKNDHVVLFFQGTKRETVKTVKEKLFLTENFEMGRLYREK